MRLASSLWFAMLFCLFGFFIDSASQARASDENLTFQSTAQETQYRTLIDEFRCPKCQNANLAGSDSPIAQDLKHKTYILVKQGQTDDQIRQYMTSRYGEFISYKPPIKRSTWALWFAPPLILFLALIIWFVRARTRENMATAPLSAEESWRLNQLLNVKKDNSSQSIGQGMHHDH